MGLIIMAVLTLIICLVIYWVYGLNDMCDVERTNACIFLLFIILGAWGTYYVFFC